MHSGPGRGQEGSVLWFKIAETNKHNLQVL